MNAEEFARIANNFYASKGIESSIDRIGLDSELVNYVSKHQQDLQKKYKVAFVFICLNALYWEYAPAMIRGAKQFFLPGHETDFFFWTDIPEDGWEIHKSIFAGFQGALANKGIQAIDERSFNRINTVTDEVIALRKRKDVHIVPTASMEWPYPTLLRYNLFLQEEEKLKDYDYIFYCDVDMEFKGIVGDEILSEGITAALHPMYALRKEYWPPYEPNEQSASYIKRPGKLIEENGKPRFMPMYFAGGFQGGKSAAFIEVMKRAKGLIDSDLAKGYIPIWNDETVFNRCMFDTPPDVVLSPSFIYPDSLINEYYVPLWGQNYPPKLMTLTKWFSTSKEGGAAVAKMLQK